MLWDSAIISLQIVPFAVPSTILSPEWGDTRTKREVEPEWRLIQRSTGEASTWPILLSRGSLVSLLGVRFAMRAFDTLSTVRMTTLHCEMLELGCHMEMSFSFVMVS
ncbi:hypothetical protein CY35_06G016600 [Sphagnum magellanicum]|nr:hypothetical protein CY35_06G016600 [Sphagnum magellanicum]